MMRFLISSLMLASASAAVTMNAEDKAFMDSFKNEDGVVEIEAGILMKIITQGDPAGLAATAEKDVKTHFKATFSDGTHFDSSHERGDMIQVPVAQTLPGWQKVLPMMREKDVVKACLEPQWAFGEAGAEGHVPPNKVVCYEITLEEVLEGGQNQYMHPDHQEFAEAYQKFMADWAEKKGYDSEL